MLKRLAALCALLLALAGTAALADDVIDVTLARGERWAVPADRLGDCVLSDGGVVAFENGDLVGLKPGRAEAQMTGERVTVFRVLVLFQEAAPADEDEVPVEKHTDYRYYAVSDGGDEDDEADAPAAPSDPETGEDEAADEPTVEDTPTPAGSAEEPAPTVEPAEPAAEPAAEAEQPAPDAADLRVQAYDRGRVPAEINKVIDFAIGEWREAANQTFSRKGSKNKYSFWQCGKGPKCDIGWCGAFLGYVFDTCGIPMDEPTKSVPHEGGEPYSVRAAGVGKINKGFEKMGRLLIRTVDKQEVLTAPPEPGYLVIYGEYKRNTLGYGYKHIGMITDVDDLGDGRYLLKTVEGNMSNRIKRYCYVYDSTQKIKNNAPCPEEYRVADGGINDYEHIETWRITNFCMTWIP